MNGQGAAARMGRFLRRACPPLVGQRARSSGGAWQEIWTEVGGGQMFARVWNGADADAPAIVLVHGYVASSRFLIPLGSQLAPHYRIYAPDLPGFGRSDDPPRALDIPELADHLAMWMQSAGIQRAVVAGHSFGCQVVADFAARYAERVSHVVLTDPTIDPSARSLPAQAARLARDVPREPLSLWLIEVVDLAAAGLGRSFRTAQFLVRDRIQDKLSHIVAPALVVRGGRDPIVPQHWAEEVARLLPDARLVVIPGAAHAVNYNSPARLASAMREFLERDLGQS